MPILTIPRRVTGKEELVILPRREFEWMREELRKKSPVALRGYEMVSWGRKKYKMPVYQLYGKAADRLDREVKDALEEHRAGKNIKALSIGEAMKKYENKAGKN